MTTEMIDYQGNSCVLISGYFFLVFLYSSIVYFSDWRKFTDLAMERVEVKGKSELNEL